MTFLHCRSRFTDYDSWKADMDADASAQQEAGMFLKQIWRAIETPDVAFFVLEVRDVEKARAFLNPTSMEIAKTRAGVSEFEWHFVESMSI